MSVLLRFSAGLDGRRQAPLEAKLTWPRSPRGGLFLWPGAVQPTASAPVDAAGLSGSARIGVGQPNHPYPGARGTPQPRQETAALRDFNSACTRRAFGGPLPSWPCLHSRMGRLVFPCRCNSLAELKSEGPCPLNVQTLASTAAETSTTLADFYSCRRSPNIHFRQCGHRCGGGRAKSARMA